MQVTNFSLVNQAFAFAKAIHGMASDMDSISTSAERLLREALFTACAFHLARAFHFYIREIADRALLKNTESISSLAELQQALMQRGVYSQDLEELSELAEQKGSWLWQLQLHSKEIMRSPPKEQEKKAFPQDNLILAVDLTSIEAGTRLVLTSDLLRDWQHAFRSLVSRQRETGAEF